MHNNKEDETQQPNYFLLCCLGIPAAFFVLNMSKFMMFRLGGWAIPTIRQSDIYPSHVGNFCLYIDSNFMICMWLCCMIVARGIGQRIAACAVFGFMFCNMAGGLWGFIAQH